MTKIEAIEKTIYNLENDVYEYDWYTEDSCNCGVMARTVLGGKLPSKCGINMSGGSGYSPFASALVCMKTGLNKNDVAIALLTVGFSFDEMLCLENLSDPKICSLLDWKLCPKDEQENYECFIGRDDKENLIQYLKAWLQILKDQQPQPKEPIREKTVYVTVPESVKEQAKELLMS